MQMFFSWRVRSVSTSFNRIPLLLKKAGEKQRFPKLRRHPPLGPGAEVALRQHLFHYVAFDVGEAEIAAHVADREARVVQAEAVQQGRLQIVHVDLVLGDIHAQLVGLADDRAALDAAAGEEEAVGRSALAG
jgi:hypothetical protein